MNGQENHKEDTAVDDYCGRIIKAAQTIADSTKEHDLSPVAVSEIGDPEGDNTTLREIADLIEFIAEAVTDEPDSYKS